MLAIGLGSLLLALLLRLGVLITERRNPTRSEAKRAADGRALAWLLTGVTLTNLPLILAVPRVLGSVFPPDAVAHAVVAQAVARSGLPHGWVDVYDAGFPFSIHYQSVALLLDAALIKLGVSALVATNGLGIAALLASPIAFAWATHRGGLSPLACLAGAIALTVAAPEHPMVGGWESYLSQGLLSQVVTIPILIVCASAVVSGTTRSETRNGLIFPADATSRGLPWIAALAVAAHTQVTVVAFAAALPAVLTAATREVRWRFLLASAGATVAALALYGMGALAFTVPFGTPNGAAWRLVGFPLDRMFDGDLLDQDRAPVLTAAWTAAAMFLLPFVRTRAARGALLFGATAILVTFGRDAVLRTPPLVHALFGFVPPARMMAVVPLAMALSVAVAPRHGALRRGRPPRARCACTVTPRLDGH